MVKQAEKKQARDFIASTFNANGIYKVQKALDFSLVVSKDKESIDVILANVMPKADDFIPHYRKNRNQGIYTAAVLYKDTKSAFVRMVERNTSWRTEKSLKKYASLEINQMISLRKIEKLVLDFYSEDELTYYQPVTQRIGESVRVFSLTPVELDYSHLTPDDQGYEFAENRDSIDYKLPKEKTVHTKGTATIVKNTRNFKAKIV